MTVGTLQASSPLRAFLESIEFSDGHVLPLRMDSLVVFCGPNNVGKSAALRNLKQLVVSGEGGKVIKAGSLKLDVSKDRFLEALSRDSVVKYTKSGKVHYAGNGFDIDKSDLDFAWMSGKLKVLNFIDGYFVCYSSTSERIEYADPPRSISILRSPPSHPIHALQANEDLLRKISDYFRRAFGSDLIVHWGAGGEVPLYVGERPELKDGEHYLARSYLERLERSAVPLHEQGDGMRAFVTVMLQAVSQPHATIILVDEPEAFLHPPQARIIGEFLADARNSGSQIFISTHSSDVLEGILSSKRKENIIVRIDRRGDTNIAASLAPEITRQISQEPLLKYSNILDGIFHKKTIVCEADSDSAFYSAILDVVQTEGRSDILFTHGNGKSSLVKIVRALRTLNVPTSAIVDIDILNDENIFRPLFLSLGGNWDGLKAEFSRFGKTIESRQNFLKVGDVRAEVESALKELKDRDPLTISARKRIIEAVAQSTPWESLKVAGRQAIPQGQSIIDFDRIYELSSKVGLWIVPVGELESFCKSPKGGHGPTWLRNIIEGFDLGTSDELSAAREFIRKVAGPISE